MKPQLKSIIATLLIIVALGVFIYPSSMIAPGKLMPEHAQLENDCFACHAPLRGVSSERCIACHKLADIGLRKTTGQPLNHTTPFHQTLREQDCQDCHNDHLGVQGFQKIHFNHALLISATRNECQECHRTPKDSLHQQQTGNCSHCHSPTKWRPTTFDHSRYFVLDDEHNTACTTCHIANDYRHSTCYGCHEHTPENIRREHEEEGIRNIEHCAQCHRNGDEVEEVEGD